MNTFLYRLLDDFDLACDPSLPYSTCSAGKEYKAKVELAGTPKEDIKVKLTPDTRRLDVYRKDKVVAKFLVPRGYGLGALESEYKDGLLTITAPQDPAQSVEVTVR